MSFILRNCTVFRKFMRVNKFQICLFYSTSQGIILPESNSNSCKESRDDLSTIFKYIESKNNLTSQNYLEILQKLSKHYSILNFRSSPSKERRDIIIFCSRLDENIKTLNLSEAIKIVNLLYKIGIPKSSIIFQSLLAKIQSEIKPDVKWNLEDVVKLKEILNKLDYLDVAKIIKHDLTLLNFNNEVTYDIYSLCSSLYKAARVEKANEQQIKQILDRIAKYPREIPNLCAKSILTSLLKVPDSVTLQYRDFFQKIQHNIIENSDKYNLKDILQIFKALEFACNEHFKSDFYNPEMVDSLIIRLMSNEKLLLEDGIDILSTLHIIGHVQMDLLDFLFMKCFEKPLLLSNLNQAQLLKLMRGLTLFSEKPPFWDSMKYCILNNKHADHSSYNGVHIAYHLAIFDFFPHDLISTVFSINLKTFHESYYSVKKRLLFLYQLVKAKDPSYSGPWPSWSVLNNLINMHLNINLFKPICNNVSSTLEKALGGPGYMKSNVATRNGHHIDHVIVMRKGGFPVAINLKNDQTNDRESPSFIEDIVVPAESQIIAILCLNPESYLRNVNRLRRDVLCYIETLEALNYTVIQIPLSEWTNLNERAKIPFVMNKIKSKCEIDQITTFIA